jgi:hypothetical protein
MHQVPGWTELIHAQEVCANAELSGDPAASLSVSASVETASTDMPSLVKLSNSTALICSTFKQPSK